MKHGRLAGLTMALSLVLATVAALAIPGTAHAAAVTTCSPWQPFIHSFNGSASASVCITRESTPVSNGYLRGHVQISNQSQTTLMGLETIVAVKPQATQPAYAGQRWLAPFTTDVAATPWYLDTTPYQADYAVAQVKYWRSDIAQYAYVNLVTPALY